ncbi:beta-lactamase-like protein [Hypoxylon crocopeplum]|nr:beta-lactamase-like protein [Hypoxylon crocopeplum]
MHIPHPQSAVNVRVIDTTSRIVVPNEFAANPVKANEFLDCPSYAFLIEHKSSRRLLFDLGVRKDYDKLPPAIQYYLEQSNATIEVEKDVHTILQDHGVDPKSIEAIIWSHWHWDHVGDPSKFDPSTALIVGPGVTETFCPGYPENEGSPLLVTDYEGRDLRELHFEEEHAVKVGRFDGLDYFGDGSFYILSAEGHTIGHLCGLAATTTSPASYVLMGADACHHSAELRPSKLAPFPSEIRPHPLQKKSPAPCSGAMFEHLLRGGDKTIPFYGQRKPGMMFCDPDMAENTIEKLQEADAADNIFIIIAHDAHIKGAIPFFPKSVNEFMTHGWQKQVRWTFLSDFKAAL